MEHREYFAIRKGHIKKDDAFTLENLRKAFKLFFDKFWEDGYFQKYFGKDCPDGDVKGALGSDIETAIYLRTGVKGVWPIWIKVDFYDEVHLFTMIEFLHDVCSKPTKVDFHNWNECGNHVIESDDVEGRKDYQKEINFILKRYKNLELSDKGEILISIEDGFENLFKAPIPSDDTENINSRIEAAIVKFRKANSNVDDRRDALKSLADVLEFIKKDAMKLQMNKDVNELFQIANTFGIRHHNKQQKTEYDKGVWHAWMFYSYLSTIHLCLRLINENAKPIS